jgi:16S rRNA (guanine527-N7)-methyltransferase
MGPQASSTAKRPFQTVPMKTEGKGQTQKFHVKHPSKNAGNKSLTAVALSGDIRERLDAFLKLLQLWNQRFNLVSRSDLALAGEKHVADSLQLMPFLIGPEHTALDLGSGAGFPGLVLAIASGWHFHLIEANRRKAAFLREAARITGASVSIHQERIEQIQLPPVPIVTARALAPLDRLLALAQPFLAPHGHCLFLKGRSVEKELATARRNWHMNVTITPSETLAHSVILQISELARAPT